MSRNTPYAAKTAVIALCGNRCAYPGCTFPFHDIELKTNVGIISHIYGIEPASARYDPDRPKAYVESGPNLIILCHPHSRRVDNPATRSEYPAEILLEWKQAVEQSGIEAPIDVTVSALRAAFGAAMADGFAALTAAVDSATALALAKDFPDLTVPGTPGGALNPAAFQPEWAVFQNGGNPIRQIEYRFVGQRVRPDDVGATWRISMLENQWRAVLVESQG